MNEKGKNETRQEYEGNEQGELNLDGNVRVKGHLQMQAGEAVGIE